MEAFWRLSSLWMLRQIIKIGCLFNFLFEGELHLLVFMRDFRKVKGEFTIWILNIKRSVVIHPESI